MATPSVTAKARDLTLKLDDSCNCRSTCCLKPQQSPCDKTKVYINSRHEIVLFDPKKGSDEALSLKRTIRHLMDHADLVAERTISSTEKISAHLEEITRDAVATGSALTLGEVDRLRKVMRDHLIGNEEEGKKE